MISQNSGSPVIVGEVLFDCFPDGASVMGGAPFNVAWHLQGLGLSPLMVSSVGDDELGQQVLTTMRGWGMETRAIQINRNFPTGRVTVSLNDGQPAYTIEQDQAYDHIDANQIIPSLDTCLRESSVREAPLLYHGSLLTRTTASRLMLEQLIGHLQSATFVDINLRPPWWSMDDIKHSIAKAKWLKLNDEELRTVMSLETADSQDLTGYAQQLFTQCQLEALIVTLGDKGALCVTADGITKGHPVSASVVDTVGAGDSFSAVIIAGLLYGWPLADTLDRALQFAAAICEMRGATTMDQSLYDRFLAQWR